MIFHSHHLLNKLKFKFKFKKHFSFSFSSSSSSSSSNLLHLCTHSQTLSQTNQLHAFSILNAFLPHSVSISASLILKYASFRHPETSLILFQNTLPFSKTAFLWNTLIRAYSIAGFFDGFGVYNTMVRSGVKPDDHTYPFVLKACSDYLKFDKGREVHGVVFKVGFDKDVFVGNTLLMFYGNCGFFVDAMNVFDEMFERDKVSWNTVIGLCSDRGFHEESLCFFKEMVVAAPVVRPDLVTVVSVLPVCADSENVVMARIVHGYVFKVGLSGHVKVGNALVDVYGKCGSEEACKKVFDEMDERNEVSWNAVITGFSFRGLSMDALDAFRSMINTGMRPNPVTISSMLPVLGELGLFKLGMEVHGYSLRMGIESDIFIGNSLIDMYAKSGSSRVASTIFNKMGDRNIVSWNSMVANFAQNRHHFAAVELLRQMQAHGENPNNVTFTNVLPACARLGFLNVGKEIHARIIQTGCATDLFLSNALTDMYSKCGHLSLARNVFNVSIKDKVSYNILIIGYSQTTNSSESLNLFSEMRLSGMTPDIVSFIGIISACAHLSSIKQGKEIHGHLVRKLFHTHLFAANSLLDLYTKCGRIDLATKVFDRIQHKDVASWNTMILGYGMRGEFETAINLFEAMKEDGGVEYDSVSYIAVLSACSHGGLIEKGNKYFKQMQDYNIEPTHTHYACMVDLLGRAGQIEEAANLIRGLSFEPDANIWGALLGACRIYGNVELGHWAAEHLFKLKPDHCGYYILLSNMYAEAGRWDEANMVRELMKSRGAKKNPGCSWVQIGDQVHGFLVGEKIESLDTGF
ncbi:putative tetratricopeptide-like helical domain-containing protein [Medicago truncatula]|uniref:Pentatricopeptide (PPR) repeat protein n=1 Tax=Medicago truncatula TaxID=3880 RepID=A0A072UUM5_MEDTR|nr:pentatricopeptide repeat-containing protein At3g16610 [Medicago truncatula]KEH33534.1 pentatricopeptide (PPR) repeat protein [Medicago truncatula]RHN66669.1 putative tetratricopeptide-like helical domain-containing protein [Medicago truncatula]